MNAKLRAMVTAFRSDPSRRFSDGEIASVVDFLDRGATGLERKICLNLVTVHYFQRGDPRAALGYAKKSFAVEPSAETAKNIAVLHRELGEHDAAIDFLQGIEGRFADKIFIHDLMCFCFYRTGRLDEAIRHGKAALELKHEKSLKSPNPVKIKEIEHKDFNPEDPNKNIVAFSLFGAEAKYIRGAIVNSVACRYVYPCWRARFYVDTSVPAEARDLLAREGAQVVMVERYPAAKFGIFWRFLVEEDGTIDRYIVRDADSVVNVKESIAVHDWCRGQYRYHVMRDQIVHSELILAGMWGSVQGSFVDFMGAASAYVKQRDKAFNFKTADQIFLREKIWPAIWRRTLIHDANYDLFGATKFPAGDVLPRRRHIGQNESVFFKPDA